MLRDPELYENFMYSFVILICSKTYSESFQVTTPLYVKLLFRNSVLGLGGRRHDTVNPVPDKKSYL